MSDGEDLERLQNNLRAYQEKLLHINAGNRSILLKKIRPKNNFDLAVLEQFRKGTVKRILNRTLVSGASPIRVLPDSAKGDDADAARSDLRKLSLNMNSIEEETGERACHIGWPFIEGGATEKFGVRGPLVLFPAYLKQNRGAQNPGWEIHFVDDRPVLNGAVISAIKKKGEVDIPDDLDELFDAMMEDVVSNGGAWSEFEFLAMFATWIAGILPMDESLNDLSYANATDMGAEDIGEMRGQGLHLRNHAVIGSFPQANNEIFKDYVKLQEIDGASDLGVMGELLGIRSGAEEPGEKADLDRTQSIELNTVFLSDSSQDEVILDSKRSGLVVVRGPPGTGKSQVIANLVCDALTNDRKVLVVCQKRAALDVVHRRLAKVGLDRFSIILDKNNSNRARMYGQLDAIILERREPIKEHEDIMPVSKKIDETVGHLSALGGALHAEYFGGVTAQMLYSRLKPGYVSRLDLGSIGTGVGYSDLEGYISRIRGLEALYKRLSNGSHPWRKRKSFAHHKRSFKQEILDDIAKMASLLDTARIMGSLDMQEKLIVKLEGYESSGGLMGGFKRRGLSKEIAEMTGADVSEEFVRNELPRAKDGAIFWGMLGDLLGLFDGRAPPEPGKAALRSMLEELRTSLDDFDDMQELDLRREDSGEVFAILDECSRKLEDEDWSEAVRQELMSHWLEQIEGDNAVLRGSPFRGYEAHVEELKVLLERKREAVVKKIQHDIANTVTVPDISGSMSPDTIKWRALHEELKKKRKVLPVRKLFNMYWDQLLRLSPCWLTSPEAASKTFPLQRNLFDLVIVDEASQLAAERSLPFLYRAKNVVVAGDDKQLRPFDLFRITDEDDETEHVSAEKSLLDIAVVRHDPHQLAWHYRSEYQNLIDFSNHAFYGGRLQVAPNVSMDPSTPPIRWIPSNGTLVKKRNHVEAGDVLDEVQKIWEGCMGGEDWPSMAVVTFNEKQQELIERTHEKRKDEDPEYLELFNRSEEANKSERFAVKNIENIQGDERDIIIFSIGYAKDPEGSFANRFDMLGMEAGENRLNVAITRARRSMVVVCSIEPSEIKETSKNPGPRLLRYFLEYAKAVSSMDVKSQEEVLSRLGDPAAVRKGAGETESYFEDRVLEGLVSRGYAVHAQIGQSGYRIDLAVVHPDDPGKYVLAVECDGASYHSAKSVIERDISRQRFLEAKGWKFMRVWSTDWWRDPEGQLDDIEKRIGELRSS
ncbi:superfamily I helicase [Cenarchaeum symbiosum A]|uniref:Superfamily I helicase n=1 Tax=Cenarchaeum symbiosum (strain A) TaxID=414004 RepID=A0RU19_CENSY|nr:superfamily I helicase [Cenarchaeum symbiosum A]